MALAGTPTSRAVGGDGSSLGNISNSPCRQGACTPLAAVAQLGFELQGRHFAIFWPAERNGVENHVLSNIEPGPAAGTGTTAARGHF